MTTGWHSLPLELRWMIFREIRLVLFLSPEWREGRQLFTALPLVSREFHSWFRHINFVFITLDQNRLDEFQRIVIKRKKRRRYVQSITLRVHLPENDSNSHGAFEGSAAAHINKAVFLNTVHKFMDIMAAWKTQKKTLLTPEYLRTKLHLEVVSPSDTRFRQLRAVSSAPARELGQHDTHPDPGQISSAEECSERREGGSLAQGAGGSSPRKFARAPVFDDLIVSRCDPHYISLEFLDEFISQGMPFLKSFFNKGWELPKIIGERHDRERFFEMSGILRRNRVRSLGRFHASSFSYNSDGTHPHGRALGTPNRIILNYTMIATGLRFCDLSSLVDGGLLIAQLSLGEMHFPELECLILSSGLMAASVFQHNETLFKLFFLAVVSTEFMPKMKVLDLSAVKSQDRLQVRIVPVKTTETRHRHVGIAWYSTWLGLENLMDAFAQTRKECLKTLWHLAIWREEQMKPAEDQRPGHVAGYHRLHYQMKRKYERINASVSTM